MKLIPFFSYYGSKHSFINEYPAPKYSVLIEPFAGSAAYAHQYPEREVILVERYAVVAEIWRWLVSVSEDELLSLPDIPHDVDTRTMRLKDVHRNFIGYQIQGGRETPRFRIGGKPRKWCHDLRIKLARQLQYIRHWQILQEDYTACINRTATWFIDPPYERAGKGYGAQLKDYLSLGRWCEQRLGQVIACEALGAQWLDFREFRSVSGVSGKSSTEAIWLKD